METQVLTKKLEFAQDVNRIVRDLCKMVFNIQTDEQVETVFGIESAKLEETIKQIIDALPEDIFQGASQKRLDEVKTICAREFIFFQVQEKGKDPTYAINLADFIRVLLQDVEKRF